MTDSTRFQQISVNQTRIRIGRKPRGNRKNYKESTKDEFAEEIGNLPKVKRASKVDGKLAPRTESDSHLFGKLRLTACGLQISRAIYNETAMRSNAEAGFLIVFDDFYFTGT